MDTSAPDASYEQLFRNLGYEFVRRELVVQALTHRSFANERPDVAPVDNERLEFLGDSVLSIVVSTFLWERFPNANEGELTRRRADLVSEQGLSAIARAIHLGNVLRLGKGEEKSGGRDKTRLLACALEACFGAAYLDGGLDAAFAMGRTLFGSRIESAAPGAADYKSRVQEWVQSKGGESPRYELLRVEGPDHARRFFVAIMVGGEVHGEGEGRSKIEAEQTAARRAMELLESGSTALAPDKEPVDQES